MDEKLIERAVSALEAIAMAYVRFVDARVKESEMNMKMYEESEHRKKEVIKFLDAANMHTRRS